MQGIFRRRNLPHWDVPGHPVFITGCLRGCFSATGLKQIDEYREELERRSKPAKFSADQWEHHKQKLFFAFVDNLLDNDSPVQHLADDEQAKIVANAFLHFANERYKLLAFVVMPSHHHWLFSVNEDWADMEIARLKLLGKQDRTPREIISHSVQSFTATMCNRSRGVEETYWQQETFDHWARTENEAIRIVHYIENNPVKAGLCAVAEDYGWSSAKIRHDLKISESQPIPKIVLP
ncbi:transposase [Novipirellula sp.]|uniref:transposase n=1 Tax=Novipirellula sp. TaxID=2795430 RepID=UPI003568E5F8